MDIFSKIKKNKIEDLFLTLKIGLEKCNETNNLEEFIFYWDKAIEASKGLLKYANSSLIRGDVYKQYNLLVSSEQKDLREAVERFTNSTIQTLKNSTNSNSGFEDYKFTINRYKNRYDKETLAFVEDSIKKVSISLGIIQPNTIQTLMKDFDNLEGLEFEQWCAELLEVNNFINVKVTKASGDHGVDILAEKNDIKYAIQCKCYSQDLGNSPVQEIHAGKNMYNCHIGVVMTNRYFTTGAKELADATGVLLWDRDKILQMLPHSSKSTHQENKENTKVLSEEDYDPLLTEAIQYIMNKKMVDKDMLQKKFKIGYARSLRLIDIMEELGILSEYNGSKPREVKLSKLEIQRIIDEL